MISKYPTHLVLKLKVSLSKAQYDMVDNFTHVVILVKARCVRVDSFRIVWVFKAKLIVLSFWLKRYEASTRRLVFAWVLLI